MLYWTMFFIFAGVFGHLWGESGPDWQLPLFPDLEGEVVGKQAMVDTIRRAAYHLGVSECAPDGSERVSGHSLRVTWGAGASPTRLAPLENSASWEVGI